MPKIAPSTAFTGPGQSFWAGKDNLAITSRVGPRYRGVRVQDLKPLVYRWDITQQPGERRVIIPSHAAAELSSPPLLEAGHDVHGFVNGQ